MSATRTWQAPEAAAVARYVSAVLSERTSTVPGLSAIEAHAAAAYCRTLPMRRDRGVLDGWLALGSEGRASWVEQTRLEFEAMQEAQR